MNSIPKLAELYPEQLSIIQQKEKRVELEVCQQSSFGGLVEQA